MFQTYNDLGGPTRGKTRAQLLRSELKKRELDGFLIPHSDEYQSEYLPPCAERLAWLTGFTGSAGFAILLDEAAYLFTDGRYTIQARQQSDPDVFEQKSLVTEPPSKWLKENLKSGLKIGYDPRMHTVQDAKTLRESCEKAGSTLIALDANPLDAVWNDQPGPPVEPVTIQGLEFAGETAQSKLARIEEKLEKSGCDALVLTQPDSIAWTLNIRGRDIAHNPVALCTAIIKRGQKPFLFIESRKIDGVARSYLEDLCNLKAPDTLATSLTALAKDAIKIQLDPKSASEWFALHLESGTATVKHEADPVVAMKAVKNEAEIAGSRAAHLRDGVAMCQFLSWLDKNAETGTLDEIIAAKKLEEFRIESGKLKDISFDTISGSGPNSAIVHYRVNEESNRPIKTGDLYLVDSGGQYEDGTTDITRTITIGTPSDEMRERFTLVLKGHIGIATARFPKGTSGVQIDGFARRHLWDAGLDFDHGTGHGVGAYLSVHEGPQSISKRGTVALEPGMIISNEPGYYKEGAYGIRIENLVLVNPPEPGPDGREILSFETLTFTPIDLTLVDAALLSDVEINWLNAYHAKTREKLAPLVEGDDLVWLNQATKPLTR